MAEEWGDMANLIPSPKELSVHNMDSISVTSSEF